MHTCTDKYTQVIGCTSSFQNPSCSHAHMYIQIHTGDWVYIKLPEPIMLTSMIIYARPDNYYWIRAPGKFRIYGSNDGTTWEVLHDQTSVRIEYYSNVATVNVNYTSRSPPALYHYIGLVVGSFSQPDYSSYMMQIAELKLYGKTSNASCTKVSSFTLPISLSWMQKNIK
jgi:hypothetical protein